MPKFIGFRIEALKAEARRLNALGDQDGLRVVINDLDALFGDDHHHALRFYTQLEQDAVKED